MNLEELQSALPHDGRLVIFRKDGATSSLKLLTDDHHVATIEEFVEMLVDAGYKDAILAALA